MARLYHARTKPFKSVKEEDFIYQVNPFTQKVEGLRVKSMKGVRDKLVRGKHPTPEVFKHYIEIEYYMRDLQVQSIDLGRIPTVKIIVDGRVNMQLVSCKIQGFANIMFPIPFSPNKEALEEYVATGTTRTSGGIDRGGIL